MWYQYKLSPALFNTLSSDVALRWTLFIPVLNYQFIIPEPVPRVCHGCMEPLQNIDTLLDYDVTSCISPFTSGRKIRDLAVKVHSAQPRDHAGLSVVTNIACRDPHTLVVVQNGACNGNGAGNAKFKQCFLDSDVTLADGLSRCRYVCTCIGPCETIIIRYQYVEWKRESPEAYRVCDIGI